tara:strand:- start:342 stop:893 length:552 start_codon:yes stop_codon:yes gene_type:complete
MTKKKILNYINEFSKIINFTENKISKIISICNLLKKIKSGNTVHIFGNGGSAAIASHFSMDLTNNTNIKCLSYNDPAIITCYSNDYKYENWVSRSIIKYGRKNDVVILISSSGKSKNMINGIKAARQKKFKSIISFTGFDKKNYLNKNSDISFWVDSKKYNMIENSHQFYLLMIVDLMKKTIK